MFDGLRMGSSTDLERKGLSLDDAKEFFGAVIDIKSGKPCNPVKMKKRLRKWK